MFSYLCFCHVLDNQFKSQISPEMEATLFTVFNLPQLFHNEIMAYSRIFPALGRSDEYPK